jgi:hypothetical protein
MKVGLLPVVLTAVVAAGLAACGSSDVARSGHAAQKAPVSTVAPGGAKTATHALPANPGTALPDVAAPPSVAAAERDVQAALTGLAAAAAGVVAQGAQASLAPAVGAFSRDLAVIQQQTALAFTAGRAGNCSDSFAASRAADAAVKPTRADLEALGRQVTQVGHARARYGAARGAALHALQNLYNAIAGHPLSTGPSTVVDQLRGEMASDDAIVADIAAQATATLNAGRRSMDSARQVAKQAALTACLVSA